MSHVVIVESPAKCKTILKYLGADYTVLASFGHIRDLPSRDGSVEPGNDFAMHYEIDADSKRHVKAIADAVKKADSLILATDPDREGEAISWHVLEALREQKALKPATKIRRVSFNAITKSAVQEAMAHPRDLDMDLVNAQQARRALDYLVGFTLSPVLWRKLPGSRSAGRVQSVALRLICEREHEIELFRSQEYWDISAEFKNAGGASFAARLTHLHGAKLEKFSLPDEAAANAAMQKIQGQSYRVASVEKKQAKRHPYAPFTTSTLQQEAARKLGFSASHTMRVAQRLYEGVEIGGETTGLITYMRTDGVTVAPEAIQAARRVIAQDHGDNYLPASPRMYQSKVKNAQEAHEAIRPADPARRPEQVTKYLDADQLKLYTLIWKRLIASQMESALLDLVVADIEAASGAARFRANGSTVRFNGFLALYEEGRDDADDENERTLPPLNQGENAALVKAAPEQHFTQPPPRYTEASLVKKLEELGIGRPSTYASILSVLQERDYVRLEKKRFIPEMRGRLVTAFLESFFRHYVEYDFTAYLEEELDQISEGKMDWKAMLREFWEPFLEATGGAMKLNFADVTAALTDALAPILFTDGGENRQCPSCKEGTLGLRLGKFGAFLGCARYPDCNFTRQLSGNAEDAGEGGAASGDKVEPRALGADPDTGLEVSLRKGPYGFYLQLGEAKGKKDKPKRAPLPKHIAPDAIDLARALAALALPREIGAHPETGKAITAGIGRFGPYLLHDGKYTSLKEDDPTEIGINRAVDVIANAGSKKGGGRAAVKPLRVLGEHPDGGEVAVYEGRYGPYVKHGKINATLPKTAAPESVTLEEAVALIAKKAESGGGKVNRRKKKTG